MLSKSHQLKTFYEKYEPRENHNGQHIGGTTKQAALKVA